jgi:hypothetical protein
VLSTATVLNTTLDPRPPQSGLTFHAAVDVDAGPPAAPRKRAPG